MPSTTLNTKIQSGSDLTPEQLRQLNEYLSTLEPQQILEWAIDTLPNLFQTTAFGLTGLATL